MIPSRPAPIIPTAKSYFTERPVPAPALAITIAEERMIPATGDLTERKRNMC